MGALLDTASYRAFLAQTHPALEIDDGRLGGVPSFVARLDIREPLVPGAMRSALDVAQEIVPEIVKPRGLFLGTPFERYDQTHLLEELPSVPELSEQASRAARARDLEVAVLTNVRPEALDLAAWASHGWSVLPSFPDTVVDLCAPDFEAHLASLPSGDRSGIRRNIKRFRRAGHTLERIVDASRLGMSLFRCYQPFFEGATVRWQAHTVAYFDGLTRLGKHVRLTAARSSEGKVIGFIVAFEDPNGLQAGRIGVHPEYHRKDAVYFRLLYHVLEEALETWGGGPNILSLEPTGYRMKRHLGARKVPLVNLILGVSDAWSILLRSMGALGRHLLRHLEDRAALERWY